MSEPKETPTVRAAAADDLPRLAAMFDAYREFYGQKPAGEQAATAFLRERLETGDSRILVAEAAGEVVGFAQLYPLLSSVAMRRCWVLNDLYVDPARRGGGAAGALLDRAAQIGRETGAPYLELATARDNRAAQTLYEKHGWRRDDVFVSYNLPLADSPD